MGIINKEIIKKIVVKITLLDICITKQQKNNIIDIIIIFKKGSVTLKS